MGTWGSGPFDNDAAADFLGELELSPSRVVKTTLKTIASLPPATYLDVDVGAAGWAACELVALAFGYGDVDDQVAEALDKLKPKDDQRALALRVLPRVADRASSELASLWHEGSDGAQFDAQIEDLTRRLQAAADGARAVKKPSAGDILLLPGGMVVQVVGAAELAVFEGTADDDATALDRVRSAPARRVRAAVGRIARSGRTVGNAPLRKDLRGKKLYAAATGMAGEYLIATASPGGARVATWDEARAYDVLRDHDLDALGAVARGEHPFGRVPSPDEVEAEKRKQESPRWAARRQTTTAEAFGDRIEVERLLQWIAHTGLENVLDEFHSQVTGQRGSGPTESWNRRLYVFAAMVALWRGTWPTSRWPVSLAGRLPPRPSDAALQQAVADARVLLASALGPDSELKLIWDDAPDGGAALRDEVASLERALAD